MKKKDQRKLNEWIDREIKVATSHFFEPKRGQRWMKYALKLENIIMTIQMELDS